MAARLAARLLRLRTGGAIACGAAAASCAAWGAAPRSVGTCEPRARAADRPAPTAPAAGVPKSRLDIRDVARGADEREAAEGMVVSVHCRVRVAATGKELERTRGSSGTGSRMYGEPFTFVLGDRREARVLGAVHAATIGMRVGGRREVRVAFHDPDFGYRTYPQDEQGRRIALHPWTELVIEVELEQIELAAPKLDVLQRAMRWAHIVWSERGQ